VAAARLSPPGQFTKRRRVERASLGRNAGALGSANAGGASIGATSTRCIGGRAGGCALRLPIGPVDGAGAGARTNRRRQATGAAAASSPGRRRPSRGAGMVVGNGGGMMPEQLGRQADDPERIALFAKYQSTRTSLKPVECDDGERCWVRDGPPAMRSHNGSNNCIGCGGRIRTRALITFDGHSYSSRVELARHLAPLTRRSVEACKGLLKRHGDDAALVLERCRRSLSLTFDWQEYPNRFALARHLAPLTGRSAQACNAMLRKHGDDAARVLLQYQASAMAWSASQISRRR
jgi:hypothetical protein